MRLDREPIDPLLDAMLRENRAETPPPHVDSAILAAAHRAVASAPRPRPRRRWRVWMPLAAAATVAAVVIGLQPAERQAPEAARTTPDSARTIDVPLPAGAAESGATPDRSNASARPAQPLSSPASARSRTEASADAREAGRASPSTDLSNDTRAANAEPSQDMRVAQAIERIRALRGDGRDREAAHALAQLRELYRDADARLPPDLQAWAGTVRR